MLLCSRLIISSSITESHSESLTTDLNPWGSFTVICTWNHGRAYKTYNEWIMWVLVIPLLAWLTIGWEVGGGWLKNKRSFKLFF